MAGKLRIVSASALLWLGTTAAGAEPAGFSLRMRVAVHCTIDYSAQGAGIAGGEMISLGQVHEYCNAPQGYELVVSYAPGTMRGARLAAGGDEIVLNGSGEAVLSRQAGPRRMARAVHASPGENGFDTDRLLFQLRPA